MACPTQQPDMDELFEIRNAYYIGNFQYCINVAQKIKISSELKLEKDIFVYLSYIAQKRYRIIMEEISDKCPIELQVLKLLSEFFSAQSIKRDVILSKFNEKFSVYERDNHFIAFVGANMYYHKGQYGKALQRLYRHTHLETLSLALQIYLSMSRVDLALKELKKMQEKDEDSTLTQLAQAWVNIAIGREKLQDAYYIIQEIIDKYGSSVSLLNCQAVCYIGQGKYEEAGSALLEARDKDDDNVHTLINLIALSAHVEKQNETVSRYLSQLNDSHADYLFVKENEEKRNEFDKLCQEYETVT